MEFNQDLALTQWFLPFNSNNNRLFPLNRFPLIRYIFCNLHYKLPLLLQLLHFPPFKPYNNNNNTNSNSNSNNDNLNLSKGWFVVDFLHQLSLRSPRLRSVIAGIEVCRVVPQLEEHLEPGPTEEPGVDLEVVPVRKSVHLPLRQYLLHHLELEDPLRQEQLRDLLHGGVLLHHLLQDVPSLQCLRSPPEIKPLIILKIACPKTETRKRSMNCK